MTASPHRIWTISNILSISRLLLLPLGLYLLSFEDRRMWLWAGVIVAYAITSDILDGVLARRLGQITEFGKILDPLADKITSGALAIFCVLNRGMPWWAAAITIGRDVVILLIGLIAYRRMHQAPSSNWLGKAGALSWGVCLGLYAFDVQPWGRYTLYPVVILFVAAGIGYAIRNRRTVNPNTT